MNYKDIPTTGAYVVLVRSTNAVARIIQFGMWLWQFFNMGRRFPRKSINHADVVVDGWVIGAIGTGVEIRSIEEAYGDGHTRKLRVFRLSTLQDDVIEIRTFLQDQVGKPYEYLNFWYHAKRIFKGGWSGKTGDPSKKEFYCIELAADAMQIIYPTKVDNTWQINPIEFMEICEVNLNELT